MLRLLLVFVLAGAGVWYFVIQGQPAATRPNARGPAPTAAPEQQRVEVTEAALTDRLNQRLSGRAFGSTPLGQATLNHVTATLQKGQLVTNGDARVGSTSVPVSVTGRIDVQSARPVVVVEDARAAGVPLPETNRQDIRAAIQDQVDQEVDRLHLKVVSVTIDDGKLILVGTRDR